MKRQWLLLLAWIISLIACLATLYMGEILDWPICHLCWYQRIGLYPLVILLGIGSYQNDPNCIRYSWPFPVITFIFATYQYLEQMIPNFSPINVCGQGVPCNTIHVKIAGFITLPFLSAIASAVILLCLYFANEKSY